MGSETTEVLYKCVCLPAEVAVKVPFRRPDENITEWIENCMGPALYLDHRTRSPLCRRREMEYAKIHIPENAPAVGAKPEVN